MGYATGTYDFYDDGGRILKRYLPDLDQVPDFVKVAEQVGQDHHVNQFALVMVDNGQVLKKFATADPGNTWLSALYFSATKHDLPDEAVKVAAANLLMACEHYGIEPQNDLYELSGDHVPDTNIVDVTGMKPGVRKVANTVEKEEATFAIERLDGSKHYPLNNAASIKAANDYFDRHVDQFEPRERREYAVKTAAATERVGMRKSASVVRYSGSEYSRGLAGFLDVRHHHLVTMDASPEVKNELLKLASKRSDMDPDSFAEALAQFDHSTGLDQFWDRSVADPWYSTFGFVKEAKGNVPAQKTYTVGNDTVTTEELHLLAERGMKTLQDNFGERFASAYMKNPTTLFESMPLPQKKIIARLASSAMDENAAGN